MKITTSGVEQLSTLKPNQPISLQIVDEELMGEKAVICTSAKSDDQNKDTEESYTIATISLEEFESNLETISNCIIISDCSKKIYKRFPYLIEKEVILQDINLASYIHNGSATHTLSTQVGFFGLSKTLPEVVAILSSYQHWIDLLSDEQNNIWQVENKIARILAKMELLGILIDKDKLLTLKDSYYKQSQELVAQIKQLLNAPDLNINSVKQLGQALNEAGFKLGKPGKSGAPSVKEEVLESLAANDSLGVIQKILDYRTVQKMYSTYTDSLLTRLDNEDRLHGEFNQTVAATGRLSSANPNLQNIPIRHPKYGSDLRSVFIAKKGYSLISADYSQIELRILAHLTQDPKLIEAFRNDEDIHSVTASEIFGIPLNEVSKSQRSVGKTLNFALMYQQGSFATARQLGVSTAEGKVYHDKYFEKFANVKPYIEKLLNEATKTGYAETMYARRAYYPDLQSNQGFLKAYAQRASFNMPIQGAEADIVKMAMIELDQTLQEKGMDCNLLLQIHDEIVFEVKDNQLTTAIKVIQETMELGQPLSVPLKVEVHSGKNWNEAK